MTLPNYSGMIINIFLIALFLISVYRGYKKGFITQVIGFFTLILAGIIAWTLYLPFGKLFSIIPKNMAPFQTTSLSEFFYQKSNAILWYIIIFIVSLIIIKFITIFLNLISKAPIINLINRVLGVGVSLISYIFIVWLLVFGLSLPLFVNGNEVIETSILKYNEVVAEKAGPILEKPLEQLTSLQKVISKPDQATTSDVENMQKWMLNNKVSLEDVVNFFKELKDE